MDISVIIPNYNGENLLKKNIPRVISVLTDFAKKRQREIEIIITDDASEDNSIQVSKTLIEKYSDIPIKLIESNLNSGFSGNVNRGVKEAVGEILLLLNTDVIPKAGFLEPLLKHFENEEVFAVACMDESIENEKIVLRGRGIGQWKRGFLIHSKGSLEKSDTLWVSGGSGAFRRSIWNELKGLNELYNPFYWEDIDLSYRALKSGYKLIFEKKSVVIHEHEKGAIKSKFSSSDVKRIAYRNQFIFVWLNATDLMILLLHILWLPVHLISGLFRLDGSFFAGLFKALILVPKIVKSRSYNVKAFKKGDREVTSVFET